MSFLENVTPEWLENQYLLWRESPERVGPDWRAFFQGFDLGQAPPAGMLSGVSYEYALKQSGVQSLIYRYRDIGHLLACTDPLTPCKRSHPLLELSAFGLSDGDLETTFHTRRFMKESATLGEIWGTMHDTYCGSIGVEFMHIQDPAERQWLIDRMEPVKNRPPFSMDGRLGILHALREAAMFEAFLQRKFPGQTRFSLEGGEVLIPLLDAAVSCAAGLGITDMLMGMPHRGRLNVLAHVFRKPYENIFSEFADNAEDGVIGEGDVKYHKGFSMDLDLPGGGRVHLALAANPSHLEAIDPVVEGKVRARQERSGDAKGERVLPVLIHGDAAFAGQGVVAETINLSQLEGYGTGGTLHIVLNNQIGFTTLPADARSSLYATDAAKMVQAPVFHVHGEDPEAALHAVRLALAYRQAFRKDVVVEVICYRRYGHNEGDEPYFTQPLMYAAIKDRPPVHDIYAARLMKEGANEAETARGVEEIAARLEEGAAREPIPLDAGFGGIWSGVRRDYAPMKVKTGVSGGALADISERLSLIPPGFKPHPKAALLLQKRRDAIKTGEGIDWGNAETLALATLLAEGKPVRISGQDARRGTFSQRHCALFDMETGNIHLPLAGVVKEKAVFSAFDSMLSEYAVLGFEYGYSVESPETLAIWEAQYGDFANGAQVVIDQFLASGETKWDRVSGLVILLPHGYEGQGAEHSSARMERFLQLSAGSNWQVAYPSTPAQYFHLLRRQAMQPFRKPLVIFTPKSLLRHPLCVSRLEELESGWFREILADGEPAGKVKTVLLCSGKIYYELLERKRADGRDDIAIIRLEQLYPLRTDLLREAVAPYRERAQFAWVQEEPANMGAWGFIRPHLFEILGKDARYAGRPEAASPATGSHRVHKEEQERIMNEAFAARQRHNH